MSPGRISNRYNWSETDNQNPILRHKNRQGWGGQGRTKLLPEAPGTAMMTNHINTSRVNTREAGFMTSNDQANLEQLLKTQTTELANPFTRHVTAISESFDHKIGLIADGHMTLHEAIQAAPGK